MQLLLNAKLERSSKTTVVGQEGPRSSAEALETAARLTALFRHVFRYDRGNQLRAVEESGLSLTQCKALLELGGSASSGSRGSSASSPRASASRSRR